MISDVLVIGSGGAGLSAALEAKKENIKVIVASKAYPTNSQTCQAQGGINAVLETTKNDSIEAFIEDTFSASKNIASKNSIKKMCESSEEIITWLDEIAVPFSRNEDSDIAQRKFGGTTKRRTCYSSDYTGLKILHTLYDQCIKKEIEFLNEYFFLDFIKEENIIHGAIFLNIQNGEVVKIFAKSIILASGGYAGIYEGFTTNSSMTTAEVIVKAYKSGAKLSNLEFVQFHPTAIKGSNTLISESARAEGAYLVDDKGNRFIDELSTRDEVARAITKKLINKEEVYLDLRHIDTKLIDELLPQEKILAKTFKDIDITKELLPIVSVAHYSMGGILCNEKAKSSLKNLFVCGECAQANIHGANRLGGNSLLEIIYSGKKAGTSAVENLKDTLIKEEIDVKDYQSYIEEILSFTKVVNVLKLKKELGEKLFHYLGVFRNEKEMEELLEYLNKLETTLKTATIEDKSKIYNKSLMELLELKETVYMAKLVTKSALSRKESRGAHFRTDYDKSLNSFEKRSVVSLKETIDEITYEDVV